MNETVIIKISDDCVMDDDDDDDDDDDYLMYWGDMNKHIHCECVEVEDIIIMMECDEIV